MVAIVKRLTHLWVSLFILYVVSRIGNVRLFFYFYVKLSFSCIKWFLCNIKEPVMNDKDPKKEVIYKSARSVLDRGIVRLEDTRYNIYSPDSIHNNYRCYDYNGASVIISGEEDNPLGYEIVYHDDSHTRVDCLRLTLRQEAKMAAIFDNLPYGIVKKCAPGIGATTLALLQPRDTILVVPTKRLAFQKYLQGYDSRRTINRFLYVGSEIPEENLDSPTDEQIYEYLSSPRQSDREFRKIIVVADSLRRVMMQLLRVESLQKEYLWQVQEIIKQGADWRQRLLTFLQDAPMVHIPKKWYLVVDEIDTFQSDGKFRESMEDVLDYYLSYPPHWRCLVSATIRPFSNPELREEPILEINYESSQERPIKIIETNNISQEVAVLLSDYRNVYPNDKIVVAYNSIRSINTVIGLLTPEIQADCSVACSSLNQAMVGEYYRSLHSGRLTTPITFITSTYFVGIDLSDRYHLISVSDPWREQTLLSPEKLFQISGRCRHPDGLLSEIIVFRLYRSKMPTAPVSVDEYLRKAEILSKYANSSDEIQETCQEVLPANFSEIKEVVVKYARHTVLGSRPISIIRKNIKNRVVPAYLNIDALMEYQHLCMHTYSSREEFLKSINATCRILEYVNHSYKKNESQIRLEEADRIDYRNVILQYIQNEIKKLTVENQRRPITDASLNRMIRNCRDNRYAREFLLRIKELYSYVPLKDLIELLTPRMGKAGIAWNKTWYRNIRRSILFTCLVEDHPFRLLLKDYFPEGSRIESNEIFEKMNAILINIQARTLKNSHAAIQLYHCFFEKKRSHNRLNYRIVGAMKNMGFTPLQRIESTATVTRLLDLI